MEPVQAHAPDPRRWQALALVCVAFFTTVLDGTIVTVALPSIKTSLNVSDNTLQWVLIAYTITFGGLLLLGGRSPASARSRLSPVSRSYAAGTSAPRRSPRRPRCFARTRTTR